MINFLIVSNNVTDCSYINLLWDVSLGLTSSISIAGKQAWHCTVGPCNMTITLYHSIFFFYGDGVASQYHNNKRIKENDSNSFQSISNIKENILTKKKAFKNECVYWLQTRKNKM